MNKLYYGDNLEVLRKYIANESIDLIYLDPPFNSKAEYNVLYKESNGNKSISQIKAFSDFWHWDEESQKTYEYLIENSSVPAKVKNLIISLHNFLGNNDMSAYLVMMTVRLLELHRVLKRTGSIYLHCDPTASHYIKLVLDAIFGENNFRNEIIWAYRTGGVGKKRFARKHDIIFFYTKSDQYKFNPLKERIYYEKPFIDTKKDEQGRYYADVFIRDVLEDKINIVENGEVNTLNVKPVLNVSKERLGYPTQKPTDLIEIFIRASSDEGDIVLDPFCGCGTTLDVAEKLHRQWIGIDITHLAIHVVKNRLKERYSNVQFEIIGEPKDLAGARELARQDRYQFQLWACALIGATPYQDKKGADSGIDCVVYNSFKGGDKTYYGIVQVKSGNVNVAHIRDFKGTMLREKADYGIFLTLEEPTQPMISEAVSSGHYRTEWGEEIPKIQILTIEDLLNGKKPEYPFPPNTTKKAERGDRAKKKNKQLNIDDLNDPINI
ncbi:MAG: DNA methyltransferase [Thermoplasmata archaeon]